MVEPNAPDRKHKGNAILGSAVFFALAPGFVAGVVPGLLTGWEVGEHLPAPLRAFGAVLGLLGIASCCTPSRGSHWRGSVPRPRWLPPSGSWLAVSTGSFGTRCISRYWP